MPPAGNYTIKYFMRWIWKNEIILVYSLWTTIMYRYLQRFNFLNLAQMNLIWNSNPFSSNRFFLSLGAFLLQLNLSPLSLMMALSFGLYAKLYYDFLPKKYKKRK